MSRINNLTNKYRYSYILLRQMVVSDFKLRYQGSILGYLWTLLKPLAIFVILYVVFVRFLKFGSSIPHFSVYLLLGIVLWSFFVEITNQGIVSIVSRDDLIRKINFPRYVIVLSVGISAFINLFFNLLVVFGFMVFTGVDPSSLAVTLPILIVELFLFAIAAAFLLSALYVKFRDISHIWEVLLQAAFYATPILYALNDVPTKYAKILVLNPVAQIIQDARYITVTQKTETIYTLYGGFKMYIIPIGIVVVFSILSAAYFRKQSKKFAEEV